MATSSAPAPKIKFYTNHGCGWCHRVHIVLRELGLQYEEVKVDLDKPRPEWFLDLNPRGLVPVIQYTPPSASDDETITLTESGPIVAFFTDLYPSHLLPSIPSSPPDPSAAATTEAALKRFRMSFFVDTYFGKVNPLMFKLVGAEEGAAQDKIVDEILGLLKKEIEPLLPDPDAKGGKGPYFGGSDTITTVEAMTTPFTIRLHAFANGIILPARLATGMLDATTLPRFTRWTELCMVHPSVTYVWERDYLVERVIERLPAAKKKYAST